MSRRPNGPIIANMTKRCASRARVLARLLARLPGARARPLHCVASPTRPVPPITARTFLLRRVEGSATSAPSAPHNYPHIAPLHHRAHLHHAPRAHPSASPPPPHTRVRASTYTHADATVCVHLRARLLAHPHPPHRCASAPAIALARPSLRPALAKSPSPPTLGPTLMCKYERGRAVRSCSYLHANMTLALTPPSPCKSRASTHLRPPV